MEDKERSRSQSKSGSRRNDDTSRSRDASVDSEGSITNQSEYDHRQDESLDKQYTKLIEYKNNLYKIDTLISLEKDEKAISELHKLKNNLQQAITYQEENIKMTQKTSTFVFSTERLLPDYVDRVF